MYTPDTVLSFPPVFLDSEPATTPLVSLLSIGGGMVACC